jgi:hypothetical protein
MIETGVDNLRRCLLGEPCDYVVPMPAPDR